MGSLATDDAGYFAALGPEPKATLVVARHRADVAHSP